MDIYTRDTMKFPWLIISLVKKKKIDDSLTTETLIIATTHLYWSTDVCGCTRNKNIYVKTIYFHTEKWGNEVMYMMLTTTCIFMWEYIAMSSQLFLISILVHHPSSHQNSFTSFLKHQQCWGKSWKKRYDEGNTQNCFLAKNKMAMFIEFQNKYQISVEWFKFVIFGGKGAN